MALLTAMMFAKGHTMLAVLSGSVLTVMTAMALGLFSVAWSMLRDGREDEIADFAAQPG